MPRSSGSTPKQKFGLIAAVRANKCLYDNRRNAFLKSNNGLWNQIAAQCGFKRGQVAKLMWKKIRDAYNAHQKNPNRTPNKTYSMLFKHMKFVDSYIIEQTEDNTPAPESQVSTEINGTTNEDVNNITTLNMNEISTTNGEFATIQYWNDTPNDASNVTELNPSSILPTFESTQQPTLQTTLQPIKENSSEFTSDTDMESYEDIFLPNNVQNETTDNSLKMFFDAMFQSTSQLPLVLQRTIKRKIFSAVIEAEEIVETQKIADLGTINRLQIRKD